MDIVIENHGSVALLRPLSDEGRQWLAEHVSDDHVVFGGAIACEPRFVEDIVNGARDDGMNVGEG